MCEVEHWGACMLEEKIDFIPCIEANYHIEINHLNMY